jgi:hypothetical protein
VVQTKVITNEISQSNSLTPYILDFDVVRVINVPNIGNIASVIALAREVLQFPPALRLHPKNGRLPKPLMGLL